MYQSLVVSRLHTKCGTCDKLCHAAEKYAIPRSMHISNIQATYHTFHTSYTVYLPLATGTYICQTIHLLLKDSYLPKAFSLSKCAYTHAHSRPMIDGLNLCASSSDTSLRSTTESLIIGG